MYIYVHIYVYNKIVVPNDPEALRLSFSLDVCRSGVAVYVCVASALHLIIPEAMRFSFHLTLKSIRSEQ